MTHPFHDPQPGCFRRTFATFLTLVVVVAVGLIALAVI